MFDRLLQGALRDAVEDTPAIFVAGARQTGKSTLVRAFAERTGGWTYRSFDDLGALAAAGADPRGFVESLGARAILDEVQRVPEILLPLKAEIDRDRRPGRFLLTGSANVLALPKVSESLAGRMEILTLWPLAQAELEGTTPGFVDACFEGRPDGLRIAGAGRADLVQRMLRGGYPEAVSRKGIEGRARWFDAYLAALLQKDLRDLAAIERLSEMPRLLRLLATRTGAQLNLADLGRALGMNQVTLKRYFTLLEALYLVFLLPPWLENRGKRLARTPKPFLNDAGLLARLLDVEPDGLGSRPADLGPILETFAVAELMRTAPFSRARPRLHHFRTADGKEVDVVMEGRGGQIVGVEVKAGSTAGTSDFAGLRLLQDMVGDRLRAGVVLHMGSEVLPFGRRLWAVPVQALWSRR